MQRLSSMLERDAFPVRETRKGKWTAEEEFYLWNHRDVLTVEKLAARLNREQEAVVAKLQQLAKKGGISHVG
ncbi:hypothetical protein GCM10008982_22640 [Anoxybacillus voinovskiensis]|nr:hypothetical protein GCM10008982_22640 [Anoxybacillus voinovskiensis]